MNKPFHKCRLCLKLGEFGSIFDQDDAVKLSEMVMSFANVQIFEGDGLSDRVCLTCTENLSTAYLFKLQCERINSLIQKSPGLLINQTPLADFDVLINKEIYLHSDYDSVVGENDKNYSTITEAEKSGNSHETSDETDSDIDSIKCVYCNQAHSTYGGHTCNVTCTIEHNELQNSSSNETLVAADETASLKSMTPTSPLKNQSECIVSCVLCDEKYDQFEEYSTHLNKCTMNVKLQHYVCPVCHEIYTEKMEFLDHLKSIHFKFTTNIIQGGFQSDVPNALASSGIDCIDFAPRIEKTRRPKAVRRQIGWSIEDIYQEIVCTKAEEKQTPTSSPIKNFFSKLGNDLSSRQSTPKRVSFRNFIDSSKAKTSSFRKYIENYRLKKKENAYSPIKGKMQVQSQLKLNFPETSDSDYNSPSGTSEESWKLKQTLICACDKKVFMLSEYIHDRDRIVSMINELGGVVAENTKMEMLATHFITVLPNDTFTGMMVCALATGKWVLHVSFIYDSFRCKKFMQENLYEWMKHPKILEIDNTSVEVAKAASYWHQELDSRDSKLPFEGKQIVLIMKKKYRQYYQMIFKTLKAKPVTYDPRTPGSCCSADYCFVDMKVIERVKLNFFAYHNVPVFPYQYILIYLLNRGQTDDEYKYLLQDHKKVQNREDVDFLNSTY